MHSRTFGALAALALALPVAGQAADSGYTFVDLALVPHARVEAGDNDVDVDGDGFQVRGSLAVSPNFFVLAELQDFGFDDRVDTTRWIVGGGGHWPINNTLDIIARAGIVRLDVEVGRFDDDDTGVFLGGRLHANVAPRVEVEGGVEYVGAEVFGLGDDVYLVGEGRYHFNEQFSAGALLNFGGDIRQLGVYGRFNF